MTQPDDRPTLRAVLAGRHAYGLSPEDQTAWCWACLLIGAGAGACLALMF